MIDSVMLWNEPNNKSHWAFEEDPDWAIFAEMAIRAADAIAAENPAHVKVLGGMSPIDPTFLTNLAGKGVLGAVDAVAVHGFPLDWNHWQINEWPAKLAEIQAVTDLPVWVTEVGVSTFGAEEVQVFGLQRTAELLIGRAPAHPLVQPLDLPRAWPATTRHREAEGSSYYRHFYMGLLARGRLAQAGPAPLRQVHARISASASGSTSRTTGSTMRCSGCASWACGSCARA